MLWDRYYWDFPHLMGEEIATKEKSTQYYILASDAGIRTPAAWGPPSESLDILLLQQHIYQIRKYGLPHPIPIHPSFINGRKLGRGLLGKEGLNHLQEALSDLDWVRCLSGLPQSPVLSPSQPGPLCLCWKVSWICETGNQGRESWAGDTMWESSGERWDLFVLLHSCLLRCSNVYFQKIQT